MHMKSHNTIKQYSCDQCEQSFYVDWRLDKHKRMHSNSKVTSCHYYNNGKVCPYEELGCKFWHQKSSFCTKKDRCQNHLCQYQHEKNTCGNDGNYDFFFKSDSSSQKLSNHEGSKKETKLINENFLSDEYIEMCL